MNKRTITVPLAWFPRLLKATPEQLENGLFVAAVMGLVGKKLMRILVPKDYYAVLPRLGRKRDYKTRNPVSLTNRVLRFWTISRLKRQARSPPEEFLPFQVCRFQIWQLSIGIKKVKVLTTKQRQ